MNPSLNFLQESSTVLVVDADRRARDLLADRLAAAGFAARGAEDATAALRIIHNEACNLVVLDRELPGVDGLALCRLLRARPVEDGGERTPVIVLSPDASQRAAAYDSGADDFLPKGTPVDEIVARVALHLKAAERAQRLAGSNREWSFLADLGRGLLQTLEPLQVMRRVAGATFEAVNPALCLAGVLTSRVAGQTFEIMDAGERSIGCVFDREGAAEELTALADNERLRWWLETNEGAPELIEDARRFLVRDARHEVEYVAPLRFGERTFGALACAFDAAEECGEPERRLIESAAQLAAFAAHISTLYTRTADAAFELTREVERRTSEAERQRRFTEAIIDSLPVSLHAIDRDYKIVAWNRNRETGGQGIPRGRAIGRHIFDVLTRQPRPVLEKEFERVFLTSQIERIEQETTGKDGATRHWLVSKIPMRADDEQSVSHIITVGEDVTARVEANRAVARAEKLAAVGRLAAGVVHEINNPLATISACAEALESRVAEGVFGESKDVDDLREYLALISSEAFRCKTITNGLLDFSRKRSGEFTPVHIADVLHSAARLIGHQSRGAAINIELDAADDLPFVSGDEGQLQQAVIALATNAIDAMSQGGTLRFAAAAERSAEGVMKMRVEVSDTGSGIAPENLPKIFEPFFTTKETGCGTGLGLAVCYGIVTEHGGTLEVDSVVNRGATFTIRLPITNPRTSPEEPQTA